MSETSRKRLEALQDEKRAPILAASEERCRAETRKEWARAAYARWKLEEQCVHEAPPLISVSDCTVVIECSVSGCYERATYYQGSNQQLRLLEATVRIRDEKRAKRKLEADAARATAAEAMSIAQDLAAQRRAELLHGHPQLESVTLDITQSDHHETSQEEPSDG